MSNTPLKDNTCCRCNEDCHEIRLRLERALSRFEQAELPEEPSGVQFVRNDVRGYGREAINYIDALRAHDAKVTVERDEAKERIVDLETLCDPAGIVRENALVSRQNIELLSKIIDLKRELAAANERAEKAEQHKGYVTKLAYDAVTQRAEAAEAELAKRDKCSFMGPMRDCPTHGESEQLKAAERRAEADARELKNAADLRYELMGVVFDVDQSPSGFDDICRQTINRVIEKLAAIDAAHNEEGKG